MSNLLTFFLGIKINVDWKAVMVPSMEKFIVHSTLSRNVGLLRLFPSITVEVVRAPFFLLISASLKCTVAVSCNGVPPS